MGRHRFSLREVCPYLKSVKIKYFVFQLLFIISTVSSDDKIKNKISGDLPLSPRNYCTTFAFFLAFFFLTWRVFLLAVVTPATAAGAFLKILAVLSDPGNEYCLSEEHTLLQAASLLSEHDPGVWQIPMAGNESYTVY